RHLAIGHGHTQHGRVALDVPAVLQTQRTEFLVAQLAGQVAFELVTELVRALADELLVKFGVLIHGASLCEMYGDGLFIWALPRGARGSTWGDGSCGERQPSARYIL